MKLKILPYEMGICKLDSLAAFDPGADLYFLGKTEEEISLVCKTADIPPGAKDRNVGWRGFYIEGVLDFSLTGILSTISSILAAHTIGIFAVSTYNTDYIFVKEKDFDRALSLLSAEGYTVLRPGSPRRPPARGPCPRPWRRPGAP